jgi:hypothetical protein
MVSLRPPHVVIPALALCASLCTHACIELDEFDTQPGQVFTGSVLGQQKPCDAGDCSDIRRGFGVGTRLTMTFDPEILTGEAGRISTTAADGSPETCGTTFDDVPLMPILPVQYDQLSLYDFPGGGRIRNYMYTLRPTSGPLSGRDVIAFVSLLQSSKIEVRLLSGSGEARCEPSTCAPYLSGSCDFYGVFTLQLARTDP